MKKKEGRIFLGFMVKEENRDSVEFQVFNFTNKIGRLASHLELDDAPHVAARFFYYNFYFISQMIPLEIVNQLIIELFIIMIALT
jgi:hypothetical protein